MQQTEPTRMLSARVPEPLFRRVQVYKATADMSVQTFVIQAVTEYLDKHEKPSRKRQ